MSAQPPMASPTGFDELLIHAHAGDNYLSGPVRAHYQMISQWLREADVDTLRAGLERPES